MSGRIDTAAERKKLGALAAAIAHIRRLTPSYDPWTAKDFADDPQGPAEVDASIATILNAVVDGQLISHHTLADALEAERDKVAAARLEGWRAGRDAAAKLCDNTAKYHMSDPDDIEVACLTASAIRALPEPKETRHD